MILGSFFPNLGDLGSTLGGCGARGLLHMEQFFNRIPYQRSNSGRERLIASIQPRKYSKNNFKTELQKKPKTTSKVLEKPIILSYEELGGLLDPGPRDCVRNVV
jgi:hypothetical protein